MSDLLQSSVAINKSDSILIGKGEVAVLWVHRFSAEPFGQHRGSALNRYRRVKLAVVQTCSRTVAQLDRRSITRTHTTHTHSFGFDDVAIWGDKT